MTLLLNNSISVQLIADPYFSGMDWEFCMIHSYFLFGKVTKGNRNIKASSSWSLCHRGATEAEPAAGTSQQQRSRRGREMAGLPQGGETPLGFRFFKHQFSCTSLPPLLLSGGKSIKSVVCWRVYHSSQNHHVTRALVVETCREENNKCKSFVKMQIIASRGQGN